MSLIAQTIGLKDFSVMVWLSLIFCLQIFSSTCVNEMEVCKGNPQCSNMNDLKWCKNATLWNEPTNWTIIVDHSMCNLTRQQDGMASQDQMIPTRQLDDKVYQCFNRADESPYSREGNNYDSGTEDGDKKDWLQWVNTPCGEDYGAKYKRRCLGMHPEQCVHVKRK